ncbi:MAG: penicillin-binding protein 2 [Clostridiaceae bacterium]
MAFFNRTNKKTNKDQAPPADVKPTHSSAADQTAAEESPATYIYRGNRSGSSDPAKQDSDSFDSASDLDRDSYVYQPQGQMEEFDEPQSYTLGDLVKEGGRVQKPGSKKMKNAHDEATDSVYRPKASYGQNTDGSQDSYNEEIYENDDFYENEDELEFDGDRADPQEYNDLSLEERYEENFEVERKILLRNIKRVAAIVLALFIGLMSYLVYFQVARAGDLRTDTGNRRNAEARNKVLRGSIFDRNGKVLAKSTLHNDGTQTREYPGGAAFGNILGYVSDKYSITGLELSMDKSLSKDMTLASFFTLDFLTSLVNPEQAVTKKQQGNSVMTTLDSDLQNYANGLLEGKKGTIVAMDPKTGEILAMVSSPGFSADKLDEVMKRVNDDKAYAAKAPLINRAINSVFAPGSTMKVLTVSSALENLSGTWDRTFDDKGVIKFPDGTTINNFNGNVYGTMTLQEAFTNSSNYIFGNLGMELTNAQFKKTAENFGFNKAITMEGMTSRKSTFPSLGENEAGNKALSAIGQGEVAATPLQMAMVAAAIANGGQMAEPSIISKVTDKDKNIVSALGTTKYSQALAPDVAKQVAQLMAQNVQKGGSAYQSLQQVNAAGKTGTGQFDAADGTRVNAWFVGYAPLKDPKIAIAVCIEDLADVNENTGARQAIPIAKNVLARWLNR